VATAEELRGWSRLVAGVADEVVAGAVQDMHRVISDGAFRWVGPLGRPVQRVHDAVVDRVYAGVRAGLRGAGELGALVADRYATPSPTPTAAKAGAIAHGVVGDRITTLAPELDIEVTLRHDGEVLAADPGVLRGLHPDTDGRIAVFVHGLVDLEHVWTGGTDGVALPALAAATGHAPLLVRYGSGRAIGRNGVDLARVLDEVTRAWPVPVTAVTLVGHSMGGLVARAAAAAAVAAGHPWGRVLTDIVLLGAPHGGSWLEKAANVGSWALRRSSPYSAPIGGVLDGRSRGIKDLRFGMLTDEGWGDADVDGLLTGLGADLPWDADTTHHLVVGRLRTGERHPLNAVFGDGLVRAGSASGGRTRRVVGPGRVVVQVDANHNGLVRHPEVADLLHGILVDE
jgi:pimeloyl-ACP methyl ester carboxylesterase